MTGRAGSLRRRLAWGLALVLVGFWLLAMAVTALVVRHEIDEVFDLHLEAGAARLLSLGAARAGGSAADLEGLLASPESDEVPVYRLRDGRGDAVLMTPGADPAVFANAPPDGFRSTATHRILVVRDPSSDISLTVAEPLEERREATWETARALLVPLLLLVPLGVAGVLWALARGLAPVERLRQALEARDVADLSPLGVPDLPRELGVIAEAADALLGRLRRALDAERAFTGDAAHELRTPIAAGLAQVQRLVAEAPPGPMVDRARQVEAQLLRLARLSGKLLDLARAEGGGVLAERPADPAPILGAVVEEFQRAGAASRLVLSLPKGGAAPSRLDPDAFAILARNLVENALRHGDPEGPVRVELAPDGTLRVRNDGPVVPPDRLADLRGRFVRGGGDGSGLGLAIAEAIARGGGARLDLRSPAPGRADGFEAVLSV